MPEVFIDFDVTITEDLNNEVPNTSDPDCDATSINAASISAANVNDVLHIWGSDEPTVTPAFSEYIIDGLTAGCDPPVVIYYQAQYRDPGNPSNLLDLPYNIEFDANTRIFSIKKCIPAEDNSGDADCALTFDDVETQTFDIVVVATLNKMTP